MRKRIKHAVSALKRCIANAPSAAEILKKSAVCKSMGLAAVYLAFGSAWILLTDFLAKRLFNDLSSILIISIGKGLFYVFATAVIIYVLVYVSLKKTMHAQNELEKVNQNLEQTIESLRESERSKAVFISHIPGIAYRCKYDREWTMQFISDGCIKLTGYRPEELIGNRQLSYNDIICEEYREMLWNEWLRIIEAKSTFRCEYEIGTISGSRKWVLEMGQPIFDESGNVDALEGIVIDISEAKHNLERILYMNDHDVLTGLYNRRYFEEKKLEAEDEANLPLSIIIADINGVRLINDAFGHPAGDELIRRTGAILKDCCGRNAVVARTGGDEFCILLPNTGRKECAQILLLIETACQRHNASVEKQELMISLSLGASVRQTPEQDINDLENEAENNMYKHKLLASESHHNAIISSVMATMYARSQETEEHAQRLAKLSKMIGMHLNLPQKGMDDLELLSMLHDIGKIGIDDRILNKPGKLTDEEWIIMKRHPEIGYRIAMSSPELKSVAEYILYHHERWDGKGYPNGIAGENIPLFSRILAVADAYDAMTEDRVYRKALDRPKAVEEIKRNAGTQFDPRIADLFINKVLPEI